MVYIINGYTGSGKDTFVELVSKLWDKAQRNSAFPSNLLKEILFLFIVVNQKISKSM